MHKVTYYPVGNGDSCQIELENGKRILLDYRQHSNGENSSSPEIDLASELRAELDSSKRDNFDVVAFTHGDSDHIAGTTEFFHLDHSSTYQSEGRIKIDELWVPAAMILEKAPYGKPNPEYITLREEAKHRLVNGYGIKVFSRPSEIDTFLKERDIDPKTRDSFFANAGKLVDTFNLGDDGVEFFCHSPFKEYTEDENDLASYRNKTALIFNIRFLHSSSQVDIFATGDSEHDVLDSIVNISKYYGNKDRLEWNLYALPHHCSYLAVGPEKGDKDTACADGVSKLLSMGRLDSYIVSSSYPIAYDSAAYDQIQPPHVQAKNTYLKKIEEVRGRKFLVTMEEPNKQKPQPLVFEIGAGGISWKKNITTAATSAALTDSRAG